jgi:hypothetical protein
MAACDRYLIRSNIGTTSPNPCRLTGESELRQLLKYIERYVTIAPLWDVQATERTPHMANIQPNRYVLQSDDGRTKIDYETSSFIGQPSLNLTEGPSPTVPIRHFSGSQIRTRKTEIGTLISVTTQISVDTGSTSFSVLIPAISVTAISDQKMFETEAIITSHSGPDSVPSTGVHETYQFIPLKGEASFVLSLLEPVMGALAKGASR